MEPRGQSKRVTTIERGGVEKGEKKEGGGVREGEEGALNQGAFAREETEKLRGHSNQRRRRREGVSVGSEWVQDEPRMDQE